MPLEKQLTWGERLFPCLILGGIPTFLCGLVIGQSAAASGSLFVGLGCATFSTLLLTLFLPHCWVPLASLFAVSFHFSYNSTLSLAAGMRVFIGLPFIALTGDTPRFENELPQQYPLIFHAVTAYLAIGLSWIRNRANKPLKTSQS